MKVNHHYLASPQHIAIISGLMLTAHLRETVNTVVIGLRAGFLPMFMNNCLHHLKTEVVELDPMILDVAREYFEFIEDARLKVHITDGIKFVKEKLADSEAVHADGKGSSKVDILIVDVDSPFQTCGFTSPRADFVEESFLLDVKSLLSEKGLFVINFVCWSPTVKGEIYSRLKMVFRNLFSIRLVDDVDEVIFALNSDSPISKNHLSEAFNTLARSLALDRPEWSQKVINALRLFGPIR